MTIRDPHHNHIGSHGHGNIETPGVGGGGGGGGGGGPSGPALQRAQSMRVRDDFGRTEIDTLARAFKRAHFSDVKGFEERMARAQQKRHDLLQEMRENHPWFDYSLFLFSLASKVSGRAGDEGKKSSLVWIQSILVQSRLESERKGR